MRWMTIDGYEAFEVNDQGEVRNKASGHVKKQSCNTGGYLTVSLYNHELKKKQKVPVHRLVAHAFVFNPNPNDFNCVNHKDENKLNNRASNLEWCDVGYNNRYGTKTQRQALSKTKPVVAIKDGKRRLYPSVEMAAKIIGCSAISIRKILAKAQYYHTCKGYTFEYLT